jgi:predicted homoserine dehydrogenase-like protein
MRTVLAKRRVLFRSTHRSMETKMRTRILTIAGMLLVAVSTMETAAARNLRKVTRAPHSAAQQLRDGTGLRPEDQGMSAPTAVDNRSCDIFWCYGK